MKNKGLELKKIVFFKYFISGGISFLLDLTLFSIFCFLLKGTFAEISIIIATILARIISSFVNYFLNRNQVFAKDNKKMDSTTLVEYYLLVVVQMLISATVVTELYRLVPIYETLIKIPVEIVLFFVNYFVQKWFIFGDKKIKYSQEGKLHLLFAFASSLLTTFALLFQITEKGFRFARANTMAVTYITMTIALFLFYKKYLGKYEGKTTYRILSLVFSLLMVFGYSYDVVENASLVLGNFSLISFSIGKTVGYYLLFSTSIHWLDHVLKEKNIPELKHSRLYAKIEQHPFLFPFIFLVLCYLPYMIGYYPGIINYDNANQIKEMMGMHTRYLDSVVLLNPEVTLTNFNPILHTLLIGGLFKVGYWLGNVNFGLFLYFVVQSTFVIGTFAYAISYLHKRKMNPRLILASLLIFGLVPIFPYYAITGVKDVIFSSLLVLYLIKIYDIIKYPQKKQDYWYFTVLILLIILFRNNGIYTILLSLPFLCILKKETRKPLLMILLANVLLYVGYNKVLLPGLEIANTSVREVLSIPFQQTARHVKYYEQDISEEDKIIIDKVLRYEDLAERYNPDLSDAVKNEFNKYTTNEELREYFGVWAKYLFKRPVVYIDATINNIYGYFYPNTSSWYVYTGLNNKLPEAGFDYHFNSLTWLRALTDGYAAIFPYIPIIGGIANIGIVVWIHLLVLGMLIVHRKKEYIVMLLPAISLILVCMAGPANTYFRYVLPLVFSLPILLCLVYHELKNAKDKSVETK